MRIVDLATGTATDVTEGTAAEHGWYHFQPEIASRWAGQLC